MKLEIDNINAKLVECTEAERAWLDEYLSFPDTQAYWKQRHYGSGDGKIHLLDRWTNAFPTGLLRSVATPVGDGPSAAGQQGFTVEIYDNRIPAIPRATDADLSWLRDYQRRAVDIAIEKERGIIWVPTAGGKTEIAAGLAVACPGRWLFLVHRTQLAIQAGERYSLRTGMPHGLITEGEWNIPDDAGMVCATFQTLVAALKNPATSQAVKDFLASAQGIIVDESHTLPADTFYEVAQLCVTARRRIGLSGTPLARGDRKSLMSVAALGNVLYRILPSVLQAAGVLAIPTIYVVDVTHPPNNQPTYQGVYGSQVVRNASRNKAIANVVKVAKKPCMVFVAQLKHGRDLTKRIERAGCGRVRFIWGASSTDQRKTALRDIAAGRVDVIVTSAVFQEGIDVPELESVVIAAAGKSTIAALQRIGRGMRIAKDASGKVIKNTFEVYDFADHGCGCTAEKNKKKHHTGCRWLEKHTKARIAAYEGEGYATTPFAEKIKIEADDVEEEDATPGAVDDFEYDNDARND